MGRGSTGIFALALLLGACAPAGYPAEPYGFEPGQRVPPLRFATLDAEGGPAELGLDRYYLAEPGEARLLLVRVGAAWCGTCRWHLAHTAELAALEVGNRVTVLDLVLANQDNLPARLADLAAYRALIDAPGDLAIDPAFQLAPAMLFQAPLPFLVIVDRRTMQILRTLEDPDPDQLAWRLVQAVDQLDGTTHPRPPSTEGPDGLTRNRWDLLRDMTLPGAPPPDPTNRVADDPAAAALGRILFSDTSLSPSGSVSCATCHDPRRAFTDGRGQAEGVAVGDRNAPSVLLAAHARWQFWDGRADSLWAQALGPFENPKELASSRLFVAHAIFDRHRAAYEAVFGPLPPLDDLARFPAAGKPGEAAWQAMAAADQAAATRVFVDVGKAIAAFERTLRVQPNALDRYAAGDLAALSEAQKVGLRTYFDLGCPQCHWGPRLTDDAFHALRFPTGRQDGRADEGRAAGIAQLLAGEFLGAGPHSDAPAAGRSFDGLAAAAAGALGAFRTPPLRGSADSAPYGHGGTLATLLDLAKLYGTAGLPADDPRAVGTVEPWLPQFTDTHAAELVPFLEVLTAPPAP